MHRKYQNPPVVEALCEVSFDPGQPWDGTLPGLVYNEIKQKFPKKRQQMVVQFGIQIRGQDPTSVPPPPAPPSQETFSRLQFLSEDEKTLIQIAPDVLTVNRLKPYSSWNELKPVIFYALDNYCKAANPKAIRKIGLRYINRIVIPLPEVKIQDYLLASPNIPDALPQRINVWLQRSEIPFDAAGVLVIQTGSVRESGQSGVVFLLDLDFVTAGEPFSIGTAEDKLEVAHQNVGLAFEECVTDMARKLFNEVTSGTG
jgi:uncharacterized protein (TIGR04255 family)